MFVPCPHCGFLVAQIVSADAGVVQRCPRCQHPLHGEDAAEASTEDAAAVTATDPAATGSALPTGGHGDDAGPAPPPAPAPRAAAGSRGRTAAPTFARPLARAAGPRASWRAWLVVAALALLLLAQLLLAQRAVLATDPGWRPLIGRTCAVLGCGIPPWREPAAFSMLSRSVDPGAPGTLAVSASFRNDARWEQPWPVLLLRLTDVNGRAVAQRALQPAEYLGDGQDPAALLAPGQAASIKVAVHEPAAEIVAFSFDFR